jgi:type IV secretion system protein VirD4
MIVQSYAQLNNVYGETVADIVKGNCGIKMFIGSNDMNTCKEYSELCGNITVVTSSQSGSIHSDDINLSTQTQVRPLIYPSDLQRLNKPGDIGHSIIVTFGNYPLKTYFTPSFKVPFYKIGKMDTSELSERFFDENEVFYSADARNKIVFSKEEQTQKEETKTVESGKTDSKESESNLDESFKSQENDKNELIKEFDNFKQNNHNGSLQEFYAYLANKIKEESND